MTDMFSKAIAMIDKKNQADYQNSYISLAYSTVIVLQDLEVLSC